MAHGKRTYFPASRQLPPPVWMDKPVAPPEIKITTQYEY